MRLIHVTKVKKQTLQDYIATCCNDTHILILYTLSGYVMILAMCVIFTSSTEGLIAARVTAFTLLNLAN